MDNLANTFFKLLLCLAIMPGIVPIGLIIYKNSLDKAELKRFREKVQRLPLQCEKQRRLFMRGEKCQQGNLCIFYSLTSAVLMTFPFHVITIANFVVLSLWLPALFIIVLLIGLAAVYCTLRIKLVDIDFRLYESDVSTPVVVEPYVQLLKRLFGIITIIIWVITAALFYALIIHR
ncbi:MAG: hypothetical protein NT002_05225 [candidate division Zixibacteria bacterium]|nr:hypothetical protein [candidate division Zixibacteria bacterium]